MLRQHNTMLTRTEEIALTRYIFQELKISADTWNWLDENVKVELLLDAAIEQKVRHT